jgi:hypothetical protein
MPIKSEKQRRFMAAVANNPKFAKKVGVPQSVGEEFMKAGKAKAKKYAMGGMKYAMGGMMPEEQMDMDMTREEQIRRGIPNQRMMDTQTQQEGIDVRTIATPPKKPAPKATPRPQAKPKMSSRYAHGGKMRGCGMAMGGKVRACKMVKMKGA